MKSLPALRNLGLAALASLTLGGCYYGDVNGASYASADCSSRYGASYWSNEPYAYDDSTYGYDCYDAADYGSGFVQIGFGGGWYQQLYYPGYGMFLFDRYGRRHSMGQDTLTYWGGRRAWWKHHGHRYGNDGYRHPGQSHRDGRHDGRRPGRGYGGGQGHGGGPVNGSSDSNWSNGPVAAPAPRERPRGDGWRGRPRGDVNGAPVTNSVPYSAPPGIEQAPLPPRMRRDGGGAGQGNGNWAAPTDVSPVEPRSVPQTRAGRMPNYVAPTVGNDGAADVPLRMVPAPPTMPESNYSPPPPPERPGVPRRDPENAVRED